jgi:hypothetical protein
VPQEGLAYVEGVGDVGYAGGGFVNVVNGVGAGEGGEVEFYAISDNVFAL